MLGHGTRRRDTDTRDWTLVRSDGVKVPVSLTITAIRGADGTLTGYLGIGRDITAERQAARELRDAEERFRNAFDQAPIGKALVSPEGRFTRVNSALCGILGYSEQELLDTSFQTLTHPDDLDADLEQMQLVLAGQSESYSMEKRYEHAEGHYIWALLSVSLVRDEGGAPLYFVSQIQDISEQKQIAERLTDLSLHDPLTGLANRVLFADRLAHAVERSRRSKERVAVLFIDLDRFKSVNDSLGHAAGDELLRQAAERMRRAVRPADTIARLGGDEFTVLCEDLGAVNDAGWVADRLSDTLERPFDLFGTEMTIGVSIGIAVADRHDSAETRAGQGRRGDVPHEERPARVAGRGVRRLALPALLPLALLLIPAPGVSAATCTATASGAWTAPAHVELPCGAGSLRRGRDPRRQDGLGRRRRQRPERRQPDAQGRDARARRLERAGYGRLRRDRRRHDQRPAVRDCSRSTLDDGVQATVDAGGLTVDGAYLNLTGDGTFAVAGPLTLTDGGWVESDVDTTWSGTAPWQIGGGAGTPPDPPPTSGFEMVGGQLTITAATAAQAAASGGDGVIQLDGGATLFKQDATTTALGSQRAARHLGDPRPRGQAERALPGLGRAQRLPGRDARAGRVGPATRTARDRPDRRDARGRARCGRRGRPAERAGAAPHRRPRRCRAGREHRRRQRAGRQRGGARRPRTGDRNRRRRRRSASTAAAGSSASRRARR